MDYDPRDGVFHQKLREDFEMPCKRCGATIVEADPQCWKCGIKFPGIYSACPECQSTNFEIKRKGANLVRGVASGLFWGPVCFLIGSCLGSADIECVCLNCGQGWLPFHPAVGGSRMSETKKYKLDDI